MSSFQNLAISRKLAGAFALVIGVFFCVSVLLFSNLNALRAAADANERTFDMTGEARTMMSSVIEQQNAVRAYTILGKPEFLKTYTENGEKLDAAARAFAALAETDEQKALGTAFMAAVKEWHETRLDRTIALAADPMTRPEAQELAGVKQLGDMRKVMKEIMAMQDERLATVHDQQHHTDELARMALWTGGAVAMAVAGIMGWLLWGSIARPVSRMTETMKALASGQHDVDVPATDRNDEIGSMAQAVLVFREAGIANLRAVAAKQRADAEQAAVVDQVGTGLGRLAQGDLTARLSGFPADYAKLQSDFNAALGAMATAVGGVGNGITAIHTGSSEVSSASTDLAHRTEEQAASLAQAAVAINDLATTMRETAKGSVLTSQSVQDAHKDATEGGQVVHDAIIAMNGIEKSSQEITQIIDVIDGIAFQTNLLALNAGVEAARAGDSGRGFAVVANEVRALAQRSADAAKDIKGLILTSSGQVQNGAALVNKAGLMLERIVAKVAEISTLTTQISSAAEAQSERLQQVNGAVGQMDRMTQQNAAMVEESTAASRSLADQADQLTALIARFKLEENAPRGRFARAA